MEDIGPFTTVIKKFETMALFKWQCTSTNFFKTPDSWVMIDKSYSDTNLIHTEVIKHVILVQNSMRVTRNCDVIQRFCYRPGNRISELISEAGFLFFSGAVPCWPSTRYNNKPMVPPNIAVLFRIREVPGFCLVPETCLDSRLSWSCSVPSGKSV